MFGYRRGYRYWQEPRFSPSVYTYIGPCRCGMGPHAFYQDRSGRIYPAWHLYRWGMPTAETKEELKEELALLKEEKEALEEKIAELEKKIKGD